MSPSATRFLQNSRDNLMQHHDVTPFYGRYSGSVSPQISQAAPVLVVRAPSGETARRP